MKERISMWKCGNCGLSFSNRKDWCDIGCGRDYTRMIEVKALLEVEDDNSK